MSKFKLIEISNKKLNLKYDGEYDKFKIAKKITLAVNQAKSDGLSLNGYTWKSVWDKKLSKWIINHDNNWCGLLGAVLVYSNCNFKGSKIEAVANILGIEKEFLLGFSNGLHGKNDKLVYNICKRKSKKGQQCRDGKEIGRIFKLAYLSDNFFKQYFYTTPKEKFDSHKWNQLEECKIFFTLGMNFNSSVKKCTECDMYGGSCKSILGTNNNYYINENWDDLKYKINKSLNLTCNEIIIKKLLS